MSKSHFWPETIFIVFEMFPRRGIHSLAEQLDSRKIFVNDHVPLIL